MNRNAGFSVVTKVLVILFVVGVCYVAYSVPRSKWAGSALWHEASEWRGHVEDYARKTSRLDGSGRDLKSPLVTDTKYGRVEATIDADGKINLRNREFNLEAVITPVLRDGVVQWNCKGTPAKDMGPNCRY